MALAYPILSFCILFFHFASISSSFDPLCHHHDYSALLQFKNSFSLNNSASTECVTIFHEPSYPKTASWKNGSNCCLWDGVTCDSKSGHVIGLDLSCSWLYGQFHPNSSLFQLSHLQILNLAYNDFLGSSISSQFGDLVTLTHLNLSASYFEGEVPPKISQLSKLVSLDLSWNRYNEILKVKPSTWEKFIFNVTNLKELVLDRVNMSSISPSSLSSLMNLSSSLVFLSLSNTGLQGNLANNILCLQNLQHLDMSGNVNLKVQLPNSSWSSHLRYLDLSYTDSSGQVPDSIGHLKSLNFLSLEGCQFEGPIPLILWNLTQLTVLNLGSNKFSGDISFLSNLQRLTSLCLSNNNFSGQIPSSLSSLEHIIDLDLSFNYFSGEIPYEFGNLSKLEALLLHGNNIEGQVPLSLGNLTQLSDLNCRYNKLVGPIPDKISKLPNLVYLHFSNNLLNGTIPLGCYSSPSLRVLVLNDNHFIGPIGQFSTFSLEKCDLSNNKLQGDFPESIFDLTNLSSLWLSSNELSGLVNFHKFSRLQYLEELDLSNNKFLSVNFDNDLDYAIPYLRRLELSSCDINSFPKLSEHFQKLKFLSLSYNKIIGKIPEWFNNVGNGSLKYLDLSHNNLTSVEHLSMRNGSLEYLDLSHNNLTSVEHLSMRNLWFLDLSYNTLQGNLPIPLFGIEFFSISNNKLNGDISSLFCNASSLVTLNLSHNNLSGLIPQCLVAFPYLSALDLQMNNFVGAIPNNFSKCSSLETLNFNNNQLEGPLPLSLVHCNQLEILDVGENMIEDAFPNWLEGLPELQVLVLRDNRFYGAIFGSQTKHPFSKLRIFDVSNNHFSGNLPFAYIKEFKGMMVIDEDVASSRYMENKNNSLYKDSVTVTWKANIMEMQRILTTFTALDLSNNMFDGEIPKFIGELHSLIGLNLSHNKIFGSIPQSMGNLKCLEWLDLSSNKLNGEIPPTLTKLNFLSILNLSQNQLEGMIPRGQQFDTFQSDSYEGNSRLCGVPLSKRCNKDEGKFPGPSSSTDGKFGFDWKPVALGYGCGMVFGMLMGYVMFSVGKPQWLVRTFGGVPKKQA